MSKKENEFEGYWCGSASSQVFIRDEIIGELKFLIDLMLKENISMPPKLAEKYRSMLSMSSTKLLRERNFQAK